MNGWVDPSTRLPCIRRRFPPACGSGPAGTYVKPMSPRSKTPVSTYVPQFGDICQTYVDLRTCWRRDKALQSYKRVFAQMSIHQKNHITRDIHLSDPCTLHRATLLS